MEYNADRSNYENPWVTQIFRSNQAMNGGIVRRSAYWVNRYASHDALVRAVRQRGFHVDLTGGQYLIYCHSGHTQKLA